MKTIVKATAKDIRMTPRKIGVVADVVRGRSVDDALVILQHTGRAAARPVSKLIASAKSNAVNNSNLKADTLQIDSIDVGPGVRYSRFRAGARGRAKPYVLRSTNMTVRIAGETKPKKKPAADKTSEGDK